MIVVAAVNIDKATVVRLYVHRYVNTVASWKLKIKALDRLVEIKSVLADVATTLELRWIDTIAVSGWNVVVAIVVVIAYTY